MNWEPPSKTSASAAKTIAAVATPHGASGIGIVRLSGSDAIFIAQNLIGKTRLRPREATLTEISVKVCESTIKDIAIVIYFKAPHSFTGEDVVEFQCHGGTLLIEKVLSALIGYGAALAEPGEFSRRAFLNGKISLDRTESIIDIINAQNETELTAASSFINGEFANAMKTIETELIETAAQIEAELDHPDDIATAPQQTYISTPTRTDITPQTAPAPNTYANTNTYTNNTNIRPRLLSVIAKIKNFTDNIRTSHYIYDGIKVAILGKPNVGKSSIFNAILGTSRSIVTDIAGTTTDTITENIQIGGYKIKFIDTAGLRQSRNQIEKQGIARTHAAIAQCDIALCIFESGTAASKQDAEILELVRTKPHIIVYNKSDLTPETPTAKNPTQTNADVIYASAKTLYNIDKIKNEIIKKTVGMADAIQHKTLANMRQLDELVAAQTALTAAAGENPTADCIASDIRTALFHIGNITGTNISETVLNQIFSKFCLGK